MLMVLVGGYIFYLCVFSHVNLDFATYQRHYLLINHIGAIRAEHDDFAIRFASATNQVCTYPHHSLMVIYVLSSASNLMSIAPFFPLRHPGRNALSSYLNWSQYDLIGILHFAWTWFIYLSVS